MTRVLVEIGWRATVKRRLALVKRQLGADPSVDNTRPKQDAMNTRRVARRVMMKRLARRQPMIDEETISQAFAEIGIAGDKATYPKQVRDGQVAHVEFAPGSEVEVSVWIFNDGTYECFGERCWRGDLEAAATTYARAVALVRRLQLKVATR